MPIPVPNLDDRNAAQLVDDLLRRIGAHTPEWTNPVPGDPGRTLIDLFGDLGEQLLYRANLIPERQRLAFLRLLDIPPLAAQPAAGLLQIQHSGNGLKPIAITPRSRCSGQPIFETTLDCDVLPLETHVYIKRRTTLEEADAVADLLAGLRTHLQPNAATLPSYITTPLFAEGIEQATDVTHAALDSQLWIAVLAQPGQDPVAVRDALGHDPESGPRLLSIGLAFDHSQPIDAIGIDAADLSAAQFRIEATSERMHGPTQASFRSCEIISDRTYGLQRDGIIRIALPDRGRFGVPVPTHDADLYAGVGDTPPRIDDDDVANRLVGWLRLRGDNADQLPVIRWAGGNCTMIEQVQSHHRALVIGQGTGAGHLRLRLPASDVRPEGLVVEVEEANRGFVPWPLVEVVGHLAPGQPGVELDAAAGVLRFGDGRRGRAPTRGARIRINGYRSGGGTQGNIPRAQLSSVDAGGQRLSCVQPLACRGGRDRETLAQTERRVGDVLRHQHRAVTASDYQSLSLTTPGVRLGRVEVLPGFHPRDQVDQVPGTVSVMVLPVADLTHGVVPRPDRRTAERVYRQLDSVRPVGTALHIIAPEYRAIAMSVAVECHDLETRDDTLRLLRLSLQAHVWPLAPGGREGRGWDLGNRLDEDELLVIAARVPGVRVLHDIKLHVQNSSGTWQRATQHSDGKRGIVLKRWQLLECLGVLAVDGEQAPDSAALAAYFGEAPGSGDLHLAVPVVPDACRPCGCTTSGSAS